MRFFVISLFITSFFSFSASAESNLCDLSPYDFNKYSHKATVIKNIVKDACITRVELCQVRPNNELCPGQPKATNEYKESFWESGKHKGVDDKLNHLAKLVFAFKGVPQEEHGTAEFERLTPGQQSERRQRPTVLEIANYETELDLFNALAFAEDPYLVQTIEDLSVHLQRHWNLLFLDRLLRRMAINVESASVKGDRDVKLSGVAALTSLVAFSSSLTSDKAPRFGKELRKIFRFLVRDSFLRKTMFGVMFNRLATEGAYQLTELFEEAPIPAPFSRIFIAQKQHDFEQILESGNWHWDKENTTAKDIISFEAKINTEMNQVYKKLIPETYGWGAGAVISGIYVGSSVKKLWDKIRGNTVKTKNSKIVTGLKASIFSAVVFTAAIYLTEKLPAQAYKMQLTRRLENALKRLKLMKTEINYDPIEKASLLMEVQALINALDLFYNGRSYPKFFASLPVFEFLLEKEGLTENETRQKLKAILSDRSELSNWNQLNPADTSGADKWKGYICRANINFKPDPAQFSLERKYIAFSNFSFNFDSIIDDHTEAISDFHQHLQSVLYDSQIDSTDEVYKIFSRTLNLQEKKLMFVKSVKKHLDTEEQNKALQDFLYTWSFEVEPAEAERQGKSYTDYKQETYDCPENPPSLEEGGHLYNPYSLGI